MKACPKCGKEYDDSWSVCLKCNCGLTDAGDSRISDDRLSILMKDIGAEFRKFDARLHNIERALNIEVSSSEGVKEVALHKVEEIFEEEVKPQGLVKESRKGDIESTIGLVWLNRIGILALFLGTAFFLKYAFDNRWIGELGRVILGLVAGFGMLVGSEVARRKRYGVISQGLHGGGVGILYLSIFAAFGFYHLIGMLPAFAFMGIVTLYCGFWSTRTDWISSAVIGLVGGFLTPFLFGLEKINPTLLFSYVALLDIGVLYVGFFKKWPELNIGSFILTQIVYTVWFQSSYKQAQWPFALFFITVFFVLYCLLSILRNLIYREKSGKADIILVLVNGVVYFGQLYNILKPFAGTLPGLLPISLGCVYMAYSYSALMRCREDKDLIISYVALAVFFVTVAMPVQLKHNWISISWALESLLLVWLGFRLNYSDIRKFGLFVGAMALAKCVFFDYEYGAFFYARYRFIFNERTLTYLVMVACLFASASLYKRYKETTSAGEKALSAFLVVLANIVLLIHLSVESRTYFARAAHLKAIADAGADMSYKYRSVFYKIYGGMFGARELAMSLLWVIYAFGLMAAGMFRKFRALRIMALVLFGISIGKIFLLDLSQLDKAYRIISFISLGAVLLVASFFYQRYKDEIHTFALKE